MSSRKKIKNWAELLPLMVDRWFEYHGVIQQVKSFSTVDNKIEIVTSDRPHPFDIKEEMAYMLYDWKPVAHKKVEAIDLLARAEFEEDMLPTTPLPLQSEVASRLAAHTMGLYEDNKLITSKIEEKQMEMIKKLGTGQTSTGFWKDAEVLSQISKDTVALQMAKLSALREVGKVVEAIFKQNPKPDNENSSNHPQD